MQKFFSPTPPFLHFPSPDWYKGVPEWFEYLDIFLTIGSWIIVLPICFYKFPYSTLLVVAFPFGVGIVGTVVMTVVTGIVLIVGFPLMQEEQWFEMDKAILFCIPWVHDQQISCGTFILPVFVAMLVPNLKVMVDAMRRPRGVPTQKEVGWMDVLGKAYAIFMAASTLIHASGAQPWLWCAVWLVSLVALIFSAVQPPMGGMMAAVVFQTPAPTLAMERWAELKSAQLTVVANVTHLMCTLYAMLVPPTTEYQFYGVLNDVLSIASNLVQYGAQAVPWLARMSLPDMGLGRTLLLQT